MYTTYSITILLIYHFTDNEEGGDILYIKEKLDKALREKTSKIDKQCQRETVETWKVNMSAKRLEKLTYERKIQEEAAIKKRTKTAMKQKLELHEACQLLLREHHIRVKRRAKQKLLAASTHYCSVCVVFCSMDEKETQRRHVQNLLVPTPAGRLFLMSICIFLHNR